jgi:LPXTG-motif cell wall-anchored protein
LVARKIGDIESASRRNGDLDKGGTLMEALQQIMYVFYAVLMLLAAGIALWFYKKKKENDR